MSGFFITFEGGEGGGKSTQLKILSETFSKAKLKHVVTREPGGVPSAALIRALLVEGDHDFNPMAETLLFYADRLEHVKKLVKPAMAEGKHVLCDRFADSTMVYQGTGRGVSEDFIRRLHHLTLKDFTPNLTLILDIDPTEGLKRAHARRGHEKRFENLSLDFHGAVREGFLAIARDDPKRCMVIDAAQSQEAVSAKIRSTIKERLGMMDL